MNLLPKDIFIRACIGHLETISLLSYVTFPDVDTVHYQMWLYLVIIFINIITNIIGKVFKYEEAVKFMESDTSVTKL